MQGLRYKFSLFIYEKKDLIFKVLSWIMWLTAVVTLASLVYYHGFSHTPEELDLLITINKSFFAVFIVNYLVRMFFSLDWRQYLRSTWVEATLLGLVIINFFTILIDKLKIRNLMVSGVKASIYIFNGSFITINWQFSKVMLSGIKQ